MDPDDAAPGAGLLVLPDHHHLPADGEVSSNWPSPTSSPWRASPAGDLRACRRRAPSVYSLPPTGWTAVPVDPQVVRAVCRCRRGRPGRSRGLPRARGSRRPPRRRPRALPSWSVFAADGARCRGRHAGRAERPRLIDDTGGGGRAIDIAFLRRRADAGRCRTRGPRWRRRPVKRQPSLALSTLGRRRPGQGVQVARPHPNCSATSAPATAPSSTAATATGDVPATTSWRMIEYLLEREALAVWSGAGGQRDRADAARHPDAGVAAGHPPCGGGHRRQDCARHSGRRAKLDVAAACLERSDVIWVSAIKGVGIDRLRDLSTSWLDHIGATTRERWPHVLVDGSREGRGWCGTAGRRNARQITGRPQGRRRLGSPSRPRSGARPGSRLPSIRSPWNHRGGASRRRAGRRPGQQPVDIGLAVESTASMRKRRPAPAARPLAAVARQAQGGSSGLGGFGLGAAGEVGRQGAVGQVVGRRLVPVETGRRIADGTGHRPARRPRRARAPRRAGGAPGPAAIGLLLAGGRPTGGRTPWRSPSRKMAWSVPISRVSGRPARPRRSAYGLALGLTRCAGTACAWTVRTPRRWPSSAVTGLGRVTASDGPTGSR